MFGRMARDRYQNSYDAERDRRSSGRRSSSTAYVPASGRVTRTRSEANAYSGSASRARANAYSRSSSRTGGASYRGSSAAGTSRGGSAYRNARSSASYSNTVRTENRAGRNSQARRSQQRAVPTARGRQRVLTEAEKEYYRKKRAQARRRKAARKRAYQARAFVLLSLCLILFLGFKGLSTIADYIDASRQNALDAMQNIGFQKDNDRIDATETTAASASDAAGGMALGDGVSTNLASAGTTTTAAITDPTHVLSNGRYLDITKPMVALTWDDGPKASVGNHLMDVLEANNGRGTFFIVGERIDQAADEVKRMATDGHEIANHSWDHDEKLSKKGSDYIRNEFDKTNQKVQELTGVTPTLARLPGGIVSTDVKNTLTMPMIFWSLDTLDWKTRDAQSTITAIQNNIKDGDIVLMHELYDATSQACDTVIPWLNQQGYQMVTVSELIQFRNASVAGGNGKQYSNFPPQPTEAAAAETTTAEGDTAAVGAAADTAETAAADNADTVDEGGDSAAGDAMSAESVTEA